MYRSVQETHRSDSVQMQSEFRKKRERWKSGRNRQGIVNLSGSVAKNDDRYSLHGTIVGLCLINPEGVL